MEFVAAAGCDLCVVINLGLDTEVAVDNRGDTEQESFGGSLVVLSHLETKDSVLGVVVDQTQIALGELEVSLSLVLLVSVKLRGDLQVVSFVSKIGSEGVLAGSQVVHVRLVKNQASVVEQESLGQDSLGILVETDTGGVGQVIVVEDHPKEGLVPVHLSVAFEGEGRGEPDLVESLAVSFDLSLDLGSLKSQMESPPQDQCVVFDLIGKRGLLSLVVHLDLGIQGRRDLLFLELQGKRDLVIVVIIEQS